LVAPFEGRYRYVGYDVFPAIRLAVREVNAAGGLEGAYVELVAYDDGADPAVAAEQARKLALDPDVMAALGHFRERTTLEARSVYAETNMALVAPTLLTMEPDIFRTSPTADELAVALLDRAPVAGLLTDGSSLGLAIQALAPAHEVALDPIVSIDAEGWMESILAAAPPVLLCDAAPVRAGEALAALRAAGWSGRFVGGPELAAADFAAVAGEAAEGATLVTPWPLPEDGSDEAEFVAAYVEVSGDSPPGPLSRPAYEAAHLVLEALRIDLAADGTASRAGTASALGTVVGAATEDAGELYWYRVSRDGSMDLVRTTTP
jgi:ABC-type branched-subunit amino acid transport system substrate-binding protein